MAKKASLRIMLDFLDDDGQKASESLDTDRLTGGVLLAGYTAHDVKSLLLPAAATDQAVTFTDCIGIVIVTEDFEFSARLVAGQQLMANLRCFVAWAHDTAAGIWTTSILLTGNTVTPSDLRIYIIEKPA